MAGIQPFRRAEQKKEIIGTAKIGTEKVFGEQGAELSGEVLHQPAGGRRGEERVKLGGIPLLRRGKTAGIGDESDDILKHDAVVKQKDGKAVAAGKGQKLRGEGLEVHVFDAQSGDAFPNELPDGGEKKVFPALGKEKAADDKVAGVELVLHVLGVFVV